MARAERTLEAKRLAQSVVDAALPARPAGAEGGEDIGVEAKCRRDLCHLGLGRPRVTLARSNRATHLGVERSGRSSVGIWEQSFDDIRNQNGISSSA